MGLPKKSGGGIGEETLLQKRRLRSLLPGKHGKLCCGTIWGKQGNALHCRPQRGRWRQPCCRRTGQCDQSPCLHRMRETIHKMKLYWNQIHPCADGHPTPTALWQSTSPVPCARWGLRDHEPRTICSSKKVIVPEEVGCCGFAGDRGFTYPELNAYALRYSVPR